MPAIGLLEMHSIAAGIRVGDAMVKRAPVEKVMAGTVHPGKYLVLVEGDVASVEEALAAGHEVTAGTLVDEIFLPDPHPEIDAVLHGQRPGGLGEALGVVELATAAAVLGAADRGLKGADVVLREMRLADDLGGKAYCLFQGLVSEVEAAVEAAVDGLRRPDLLVGQVVIPQFHDEMSDNLAAAPEFLAQRRTGGK